MDGMSKISQTSSDKVNGKLVKYREGDCLTVGCKNGKYLALFVSKKFNKFYDLTLLDFYKKRKPTLQEFIDGKFFGTRFGSWEDLTYAVNVRMIACKYIDNNVDIEKIGKLNLTSTFKNDGYAYLNNIDELLKYYLEELPVRVEKSKNAEKFPDLAFVGKHLVDVKHIVDQHPPTTDG
jgi:hypothetical protein